MVMTVAHEQDHKKVYVSVICEIFCLPFSAISTGYQSVECRSGERKEKGKKSYSLIPVLMVHYINVQAVQASVNKLFNGINSFITDA